MNRATFLSREVVFAGSMVVLGVVVWILRERPSDSPRGAEPKKLDLVSPQPVLDGLEGIIPRFDSAEAALQWAWAKVSLSNMGRAQSAQEMSDAEAMLRLLGDAPIDARIRIQAKYVLMQYLAPGARILTPDIRNTREAEVLQLREDIFEILEGAGGVVDRSWGRWENCCRRS
jgi:hypothetical protein